MCVCVCIRACVCVCVFVLNSVGVLCCKLGALLSVMLVVHVLHVWLVPIDIHVIGCIFSSNFGVSPSETLSMDDFLKVVGQLKFRGTSVLFRLPRSPVNRVQVRGQPAAVSPVFVKKMNFAQPETIKEEPEAMDTSKPCG